MFNKFLKNHFKIIILIIIILVVGIGGYKYLNSKQQQPNYQTTVVEKGTLVTSISASGQIINGSVSITTQASGVINNVYVKNGDNVVQGQKIAEITFDAQSQQKQAAAWASYLQAKNSLDSANNSINTLQNLAFVANQKLINDAVARGLATTDPTYIEENSSWLAAEANYKNQQNVINQTQVSVNSAWLAYQQISSTITAPVAGIISGLTIAPGSAISSSTSTTNTAQILGSIIQPGPIQAQVNLSEIDSVNVNPGQKATLDMDAFPGKTFTGRVVSINTNGSVSSGVVVYPALIAFDTQMDHIYPNMGVNAKIITQVKDNVLLIPSVAIQTQNNQSTVRILKNGQIQTVPVSVGDSNDTQTEVTSGLSEGDLVVTNVISTTRGTSGQGSSPFGTGGRGGFGGGGGNFRVIGGGRGG